MNKKMSKLFAGTGVLAMSACLLMPMVNAETITSVDSSNTSTGKAYVNSTIIQPTTYSVDVTWEGNQQYYFYQTDSWNPGTLNYDKVPANSYWCTVNPGSYGEAISSENCKSETADGFVRPTIHVTVRNNSSLGIKSSIAYEYTSGLTGTTTYGTTGIKGSDSSEYITNNTLGSGSTGHYWTVLNDPTVNDTTSNEGKGLEAAGLVTITAE